MANNSFISIFPRMRKKKTKGRLNFKYSVSRIGYEECPISNSNTKYTATKVNIIIKQLFPFNIFFHSNVQRVDQ